MNDTPLPAEIELKLSAQEVNSVVAFLLKFPAEQVYPLLKKIEAQCVAQAAAAAQDKPAAAASGEPAGA